MTTTPVHSITDEQIAELESHCQKFHGFAITSQMVMQMIARLREAEKDAAPKWISVDEDIPANNQIVLLVAINQGPKKSYTTDMYCGWRNGTEWSRWMHPFSPTHWMPLPNPPTAMHGDK